MRRHPLYVQEPGTVLAKRGGRLVAVRDGHVAASAPLIALSEVVVFGHIGVTTPALHALLANDVPLVLLRGDGRVRGRLEPPGSPHVLLRQMQLERSGDPAFCLGVAQAVIAGKIRNQRQLLARYTARTGHAERLAELQERLAALTARAGDAGSIAALHGVEGAASGAYFAGVRLLFNDAGVPFRRRDRVSSDVANALVNYCSALLRETVLTAVVAVGLDPHVSFLHAPARGRPTLAFDLMEEWRPVLLERTVLALLRLRQVTVDNVAATPDGPRLSEDARVAAIRRFRFALDAAASAWPPVPAGRTYADQVRAQATHLRAAVRGDVDAYTPFRWR